MKNTIIFNKGIIFNSRTLTLYFNFKELSMT